jgi:3-oxoacyl-[acyl-carrier-protein] synthase-3
MTLYSTIRGTGSYLPSRIVRNEDLLDSEFYESTGAKFERPTEEIIRKFEKITGIAERRYVSDDLVTSDIAYFAAMDALDTSAVDPEDLDYIIVAHNFGDVTAGNGRSEFVPSLASRVKEKLQIANPKTIPYDLPFGCPGWLQGVIQANCFLKSGSANRALVIGAETFSRVMDPHDRDSMIYADGAGATILEVVESEKPVGILSHAVRSDTLKHAYTLKMGKSYNQNQVDGSLYLKMDGHKVYQYALRTVPALVRECLEKARVTLGDVKKVLLHQANTKMDEAILARLFRLCGKKEVPPDVMPMTVSWLGNSSVATLPTLFDLVVKGKLDNHGLERGDVVVFASIGAGMNINAVTYQMP